MTPRRPQQPSEDAKRAVRDDQPSSRTASPPITRGTAREDSRAAESAPSANGGAVARWLSGLRGSVGPLVSAGVVIVCVIAIAPTAQAYLRQQAHIRDLEEQVQHTSDRVRDLQNGIARWNDPAYVRSQARDRLFFVAPGDVSYIVTGEEGEPPLPQLPPVTDSLQETSIAWPSALLGSLVEAGTTTSPAPGQSPDDDPADSNDSH